MASTGIRRRHADKHNSICTSLEVDWYWSSQFPILLYFSTVFSFDDRFQSFFIYPFTHVPYVDSSVFRLSVLSSVFVKGLLLCTLSSWGRRRTWLCTASHMQKIVYFLYHINSCSTKQLHKLVRQVIHPVYLFLLTSIYPHTVKFSKPFFFDIWAIYFSCLVRMLRMSLFFPFSLRPRRLPTCSIYGILRILLEIIFLLWHVSSPFVRRLSSVCFHKGGAILHKT